MKAYRIWTNGETFWVASTCALPGSKRAIRDGVDWGYETDPEKAIDLSPYWARRFAADCRRCGDTARFA